MTVGTGKNPFGKRGRGDKELRDVFGFGVTGNRDRLNTHENCEQDQKARDKTHRLFSVLKTKEMSYDE